MPANPDRYSHLKFPVNHAPTPLPCGVTYPPPPCSLLTPHTPGRCPTFTPDIYHATVVGPVPTAYHPQHGHYTRLPGGVGAIHYNISTLPRFGWRVIEPQD